MKPRGQIVSQFSADTPLSDVVSASVLPRCRDYPGMKAIKQISEVYRDVKEIEHSSEDPLVKWAMFCFWIQQLLADTEAEAKRKGAQECREMMALFVEGQGQPQIAGSIRANWNSAWGKDPGKPR